jgi:hypothetical protein
VALSNTLDLFLTFQVKGTSGGSNKAVRHLQHHLGTSTGGTLGNGTALYAITFTQGNHLLAV